ncbi:MAG: competence protein ComK [Bacilli bacterium]|nr:MAG: competence protein ComK [Bacilli bacterium]
MNRYIINDDVLCFTSINKGTGTFLIEKDKELDLEINPLDLVKLSCKFLW